MVVDSLGLFSCAGAVAGCFLHRPDGVLSARRPVSKADAIRQDKLTDADLRTRAPFQPHLQPHSAVLALQRLPVSYLLMHEVKDTLRAKVRIGYDGRVHKTFRGPKAEERFANEVKVLRYLETRECPFVPRLIEANPETLTMVTTSCGRRIEQISDERKAELFKEVEQYGVRHDDAEMRNITYRQSDGRFCLIDFEFATILDEAGAAGEKSSDS